MQNFKEFYLCMPEYSFYQGIVVHVRFIAAVNGVQASIIMRSCRTGKSNLAILSLRLSALPGLLHKSIIIAVSFTALFSQSAWK